jgi:ABC-2 type transport system permease protein
MALGISVGTAAIAGDEETGTLEYLLSKPVTRSQIVLARFATIIVIILIVALASGLVLLIAAPLFDLTTATTSTASDGSTVTNPGIAFDNIAWGTLGAFAVGLGTGALAFAVGSATGRKGVTMGATSGFVIAGYLLYTLTNLTGDAEFLSWISPWRWYVDDAMFVNGWSVDILWPLAETILALGASLWLFNRRDIQG